MKDIPRLNGVIRVLEEGKPTFVTFAPAEIDAAQAIEAERFLAAQGASAKAAE